VPSYRKKGRGGQEHVLDWSKTRMKYLGEVKKMGSRWSRRKNARAVLLLFVREVTRRGYCAADNPAGKAPEGPLPCPATPTCHQTRRSALLIPMHKTTKPEFLAVRGPRKLSVKEGLANGQRGLVPSARGPVSQAEETGKSQDFETDRGGKTSKVSTRAMEWRRGASRDGNNIPGNANRDPCWPCENHGQKMGEAGTPCRADRIREH